MSRISGELLLESLRRVEDGEKADLVFAELWANSEHKEVKGDAAQVLEVSVSGGLGSRTTASRPVRPEITWGQMMASPLSHYAGRLEEYADALEAEVRAERDLELRLWLMTEDRDAVLARCVRVEEALRQLDAEFKSRGISVTVWPRSVIAQGLAAPEAEEPQ